MSSATDQPAMHAPASLQGSGSRGRSFTKSISRRTQHNVEVVAASLAVNVMTLALPLIILQVYDRIIPNGSIDTFIFMAVGLTVVIVLDFVLRTIRSYVTSWSAARFEYLANQEAVRNLLNTKIESFERTPASAHMDRLSGIDTVRDFRSGQGVIAFSDLPFVAIFIVLIAVIGQTLVLAPLVIIGVAVLMAVWLARRLDHAVKLRNELDDQRYNFIFQALSGIHTVKGLGLEALISRQYQSYHAKLAPVIREVAFLSSIAQSSGAILGNLSMISVAVVGSVMVIDGKITGGALIASTLLAGRAIQPVIKMISVWVQSRNMKIAEADLDYLADLPQELFDDSDTALLARPSGAITLDNVTVHRGRPDLPILNNVNVEIGAGEIVAVTGAFAGGKSTLLQILAGLTAVDEGRIMFDQHDAGEIGFRALRRHIGFVRRDEVLFRGSIIDNLTSFRGREFLEDALPIAERLGLADTIAQLPKGLGTQVGDTASEGLPASIQQLIALVRVLARETPVVLLDEANSALDFDADTKLRELLEERRGSTTVIMSTSRPSMIRIADKIIHVERGVVEIKANPDRPAGGGAP